MKIYLRDKDTGECHIVRINEQSSEFTDVILDQFNLSNMGVIPENEYIPAAEMMTLDLCDPNNYDLTIGTLETTKL